MNHQSDNPMEPNDSTLPEHPPGRSTAHQLLINSLSTYGRLAGTFIIGLIITPYLGQEDHLGLAGFGLFLILLSSVGLVTFVQTTVRSSLIRELSDAFHDSDPLTLPRRFTAAVIGSLLLGVILCSIMLAGTPLAVVIIQFPSDFQSQVIGAWIILSLEVVFLVLTVPCTILYDARNLIPITNLIQLCERGCSIIAALLVFAVGLGRSTPLLSFVLVDSSLKTLVRLIAGGIAYVTCSPVRFRFSLLSRSELWRLFHTGRFVVMQEVATNLYNRANQLLTNLFLGSAANSLFGASIQLKEYSRQIGLGLCFGIEPLAAGFASREDGGRKHVGPLLLTITRIEAGVIFPIIALVTMLAHPLVDLWLREKFNSQWSDANFVIANMVIILLAGNTFFVIAQGMLRIMLGAGQVRHYASKLLYAGIIQTVLAAAIYWFMRTRFGFETEHDKANAMYAISGCMSLVQIVTYGVYLPLLACRLYHLTWRDMYIGSMVPGVITGMITAIVILLGRWFVEIQTWQAVLIVSVIAGVLTAGSAYFIVLKKQERRRLMEVLKRHG